MPVSLYHVSVPVYAHFLQSLAGILDKAAAHAEEKKVKPEALLQARLFSDMWSFAEQVRAACNHATRGPARVSGVPIPEFAGKDASFAELKARVQWALGFLKGLKAEQFEGGSERALEIPLGERKLKTTGERYLLYFSLPNFYFHATTAYDILRHNGVPVTKLDLVPID
jgi:uncharacterized protein